MAASILRKATDMTDPNVVTSFDDVTALLSLDGVSHRADPARDEVHIPTRLGAEEAVLMLRWNNGFLQLFQDMNEAVEPARLADMDEAVTRLNHAMPVPGFGMNPSSNQLYYRLTVPLRQGGVLPSTALRALFSAAVKNAADFLPALRRVARGELAPGEILVQAAAFIAARDPSVPTA